MSAQELIVIQLWRAGMCAGQITRFLLRRHGLYSEEADIMAIVRKANAQRSENQEEHDSPDPDELVYREILQQMTKPGSIQ